MWLCLPPRLGRSRVRVHVQNGQRLFGRSGSDSLAENIVKGHDRPALAPLEVAATLHVQPRLHAPHLPQVDAATAFVDDARIANGHLFMTCIIRVWS